MTHGQFIAGLTLIILGACVLAFIGIRWVSRPTDEPIEHEDGEP